MEANARGNETKKDVFREKIRPGIDRGRVAIPIRVLGTKDIGVDGRVFLIAETKGENSWGGRRIGTSAHVRGGVFETSA